MAEFHRKIELQSPDDLQYLVSNVRRAANEKIDKDLPPIEGEDKMRERVEELVHSYVNDVFHKAAVNITINGLDPSEELINNILANSTSPLHHEIEEHEPFNAKLFEKAKERTREEEELIEEIAALRRKVPGSIAESTKRIYKEGVEGDEEQLRVRQVLAKEQGRLQISLGALERQEEMEANWEKGIKGLERLMKTMPEMVARKERAERAEAVATG
ncbi:hypothetical protein L207DRAFT_510720 [Hyaloscypha variabilis F]|uniref:Kinetochore protein mis14 n=1 Tax=Hyaloscypha variabilis (strain UAMH 11265 / GT02V1 / F) TaxID=1149755 RepID=A0A2J6RVI0_HYAVF|nr:hypothetical protein L207DRAFT_510720 [Hyaloscypha variabilis F]